MKTRSLILLSTLVAILPLSSQAQLVIDIGTFSGDPSTAAVAAAGVTENLSGAVLASRLGSATSSGTTFNVSPALTISFYNPTDGTTLQAPSGSFGGNAFTNNLLKDYWFITAGLSRQVSVTGLNTTLTYSGPTGLGYDPGSVNNTFTLQANSSYFLYVYGIGDTNGQNSTFTLLPSSGTIIGATSGTTSGTIPSADNAGHFVKFQFTTPANLDNYDLRFNWAASSGAASALNGIVITPVPEPSALGLLGLGLAFVLGRRRK